MELIIAQHTQDKDLLDIKAYVDTRESDLNRMLSKLKDLEPTLLQYLRAKEAEAVKNG